MKEYKLKYRGKEIASISYPEDEDRNPADVLRELGEYLLQYLEQREVMADDREGATGADRGVSGRAAVISRG